MKIFSSIITPKYCYIPISKNKQLEYQLELFGQINDDSKIFNFKALLNRKKDHAGLFLELEIIKIFWISLSLHDNRHWDYQKDCWKDHF